MPGSYLVLALLVSAQRAPWPALLPLVTLPTALRCALDIRAGSGVDTLDRLLVRTARLHLRFCALLALGLALAVLADRLT